jgi:2'-5' RNA ligase
VPTIGVALAIPQPWASELQDYRTSVGDATATMIPTHITLIPPVEVSEDDLPGIEDHLAEIAGRSSAFHIHLRGTGTFRPVSPVVFVTVVEGISACEQLAWALHRAFKELEGFECVFDAEAFRLYVHDEEKGWQPSREFPLLPHEG